MRGRMSLLKISPERMLGIMKTVMGTFLSSFHLAFRITEMVVELV
jgi:hypothetical protein